MIMNLSKIKKIAERELKREQLRNLVDKEKEKLRRKDTFWSRIFPFKITIERR